MKRRARCVDGRGGLVSQVNEVIEHDVETYEERPSLKFHQLRRELLLACTDKVALPEKPFTLNTGGAGVHRKL
jgi:hypothetical protein